MVLTGCHLPYLAATVFQEGQEEPLYGLKSNVESLACTNELVSGVADLCYVLYPQEIER